MIRSVKAILSGAVPVALALATVLAAMPAAAQMDNVEAARKERTPKPPAPTPAAPPALPGATSDATQAVPSNGSTAAMSPNDLLFDAINRGDIGDARDAMQRGADLGARNILGMTPIDLSVDLSRNDITFMLLSMRGAVGVTSGAKTAAAATRLANPLKSQPPVTAHRPAPTLVVAQTPPATPAPTPKPQPLATNPGSPAPQAGFLGFGGAPRQ